MIVAYDNGNVMVEGNTADLLAEFACIVASVKQMCEKHFNEETTLHIIAKCGEYGMSLCETETLDMAEFILSIDKIVSEHKLIEN